MARRLSVQVVPVLTQGKHRSPRDGACFMEYASFLAGERWSDHPKCTHSLLAGVARAVNDNMSDEGRHRLVGLIPSVIGLSGDDPRMDAGIAIRCAALAVPVVAEQRQRALAAGLIATERLLTELNRESSAPIDFRELRGDAWRALDTVPHAARWALDFTRGTDLTARTLKRQSAPSIVRVAVVGIAQACIPDPDERLGDLLSAVIEDCTRWMGLDSVIHTAKPEQALSGITH